MCLPPSLPLGVCGGMTVAQAMLGSGSEMVMDVAPGVDWTAMVAILMAVQQVRNCVWEFVFGRLCDVVCRQADLSIALCRQHAAMG